ARKVIQSEMRLSNRTSAARKVLACKSRRSLLKVMVYATWRKNSWRNSKMVSELSSEIARMCCRARFSSFGCTSETELSQMRAIKARGPVRPTIEAADRTERRSGERLEIREETRASTVSGILSELAAATTA